MGQHVHRLTGAQLADDGVEIVGEMGHGVGRNGFGHR
ncbi:Uncharacterised protein [Mycobacterium tuberculosis]|nr:Uncharacterised protein [Mycobacterium tuberculosis]